MTRILTIIAVVSGLFLAAGCGPQNGAETYGNGAAPAPDYDAEARETISEENIDAVLDELEAEIAADEAAAEEED